MKRKTALALILSLILPFFCSCTAKELPQEEIDKKNGTLTLSFAECVYLNVGAAENGVGSKIVNVVKVKNFAGDEKYYILCENASGKKFEILMHGITGEDEPTYNHEGEYSIGDYTEKIIRSDFSGLHYYSDGDNSKFIPSGGAMSAEIIAQEKADFETRDHDIYIDQLNSSPLRINKNTIQDGIKEVTGHTVVESDFDYLTEKTSNAYKAFHEAQKTEEEIHYSAPKRCAFFVISVTAAKAPLVLKGSSHEVTEGIGVKTARDPSHCA